MFRVLNFLELQEEDGETHFRLSTYHIRDEVYKLGVQVWVSENP